MVIPRPYLRFLPVASIGVVSLLAIGVVLLVKDMLQKSPPPKPRMQMVTLFVPPPPRFEKPPEPEIQKQDVKMQDVVEQTPEAPPPGSDLGVDADGNGADSFGLKARKGGRGLLDGGPFGWYAARLDADIQEHIADDKKLRRQGRYSALLRLWIARDGRIQRVEVARTSGNREIDTALRTALVQMQRVREPPPAEMPQPVQLQITSRL